MNNKQLIKRAIIDSLGTVAYIFLISLFLNNASKLFGEADNKFLFPVVFLLIFILSALLTGFLILGKPLMLYIDKEKKQSLKLLFYTGVSLFAILIIIGTILVVIKQ